ncbi:acyl-CoA synthetase (AMP-forming)/AMP-acid ligase II [Humibacillus xanthopallidus]|uniref:Acyl-CoA synthetase (AMP-forming)/AMP-acid ligase II n=1 Tax=Humibacillus xanthopallidus TaxID=412689 RepID=A0A543PT49_9MICO|nr:class I adenylate-forming enzyme family protein [Humibacillus xanthopallidus]TQN47234.1 acyl-CoA synthetase (AMP-forming)/AMP-acid ligase II [Humibacillus xanthopallidus]
MTLTSAPEVVSALLARADDHPTRVAIRDHHGRSVTYGDLGRGVRAVAAHLAGAGSAPGDGVLLAVRPSPRAVMAALGVVLARGVVVVADPGAGAALRDVRRRIVPVRAAVADAVVHAATRRPLSTLLARWPSTAGLQLPDLSEPHLVHVVTGPRLPGVPRRATRWESLTEGEVVRAPGDPSRDALVVFTSGSTAAPRAVVHSVRSLSAGVLAAVDALGLDEHVVLHTDQLMIGLPTLVAGGRWSLPPVTATTAGWVRQAAREGATHLYAVPAKLLAAAELGLPPTVWHVAMGGAPVLPTGVRRIMQLAPGVTVRAVYGLTEALPVAVATGEQVLGSPPGRICLGFPLPGVSVRIDGLDENGPLDGDGEVVARVGEIVVVAPQGRDRIAGEEPTREVHTGDLGSLAPDGSLLLAGRSKSMIIRGQANIYPDLVEPLLREHTGLGIHDCALVGMADPVSGDERVVLAVVPEHTPARWATVQALARAVHRAWPDLADEGWRPDEVVLVQEVPRRGRSAAVDLEALRDLVAAARAADRA